MIVLSLRFTPLQVNMGPQKEFTLATKAVHRAERQFCVLSSPWGSHPGSQNRQLPQAVVEEEEEEEMDFDLFG